MFTICLRLKSLHASEHNPNDKKKEYGERISVQNPAANDRSINCDGIRTVAAIKQLWINTCDNIPVD